ncbi:hypothetical protein B4099_1115 [Heyndrickxia coagulans]|uniref:Uncharacterized protein n=1 Tax=Heyndrickxia coagulans TaxID=1398 RepID=A0A150KFW3_HEYCO|nr:hypothetical protein B4099_1115 [Heyndrickxia coagulans]
MTGNLEAHKPKLARCQAKINWQCCGMKRKGNANRSRKKPDAQACGRAKKKAANQVFYLYFSIKMNI